MYCISLILVMLALLVYLYGTVLEKRTLREELYKHATANVVMRCKLSQINAWAVLKQGDDMSWDFFEDAADSLDKDKGSRYAIIVNKAGEDRCRVSTNFKSEEMFDIMINALKEQKKEQP